MNFSKEGNLDFIKEISMKVGIPELENAGVIVNADGTKIVSWQGYLKLGLVLGFPRLARCNTAFILS